MQPRRTVAGGAFVRRPLSMTRPADDRAVKGQVAMLKAADDIRPRVLLVEDEILVAMGVEALLAASGVEVVGVASSAEEAVRLAESEHPDLALMDIRLKGKRDGVDAALEMRRKTGIRCIFLTAYTGAATRARATPAEPLGWVSKPCATESLVPMVKAAVAELKRKH